VGELRTYLRAGKYAFRIELVFSPFPFNPYQFSTSFFPSECYQFQYFPVDVPMKISFDAIGSSSYILVEDGTAIVKGLSVKVRFYSSSAF
jgi:hypothetical protein